MKECAKEFIEFLKSRGFEIRVKEEDKLTIVGFISKIDEEKKVFFTIVFDEEDYKILIQGAKFLPGGIKEERKPFVLEAMNIANDTGINYKYVTRDDEIIIEGYYLIRILDNFNINMLIRIIAEMQDRIKSDYEIFMKVMN
ncbi:hypothetical protein [uncultured Clostridium sp.]|uniref:hypothetical protein n=1 Tax=uncultured Clostridium sp. TaxID=59620 RepID=UPI0025DD3B09|nr:hypothetical protein [uncultured Clostridium sp.]